MNISFVLQNLLELHHISPTELSRRSNVPQPTLHRLLSGPTRKPNSSTAEALCVFFKVNKNQLLGIEPLNHCRANDHLLRIPLVSWDNIYEFYLDNFDVKFDIKTIVVDPTITKNSFALITTDSTMEPLFPPETTLIFDPTHEIKDRCYVLVFIKDEKKAIFRQLIIDGNLRFLKTLNPDIANIMIRKLTSDDLILGTLIQAKKNYL